MPGLYPIIDVDSLTALKLPIVDFAKAVLRVRPQMLQLRAKHLSARETLALLRVLQPLCKAAGVELFANDRPDLAVLADCDGVHLGQDDLPVHAARQFAPALKVGISTHDLEQLSTALKDAPDYVAFGPVFSTRSKHRPDPVVGLQALEQALLAAKAHSCSLVAIGGITLENAAQIAEQGVMGAVIGGFLPPDGDLESVASLTLALHLELGGVVRGA
jgi:thiamine-phosphate pyrophosphorylase